MRQYLRADLQAIQSVEILKMVDPLRLDTIKAKGDAHPEIRAYGIGHEGSHSFNLIGIGRKVVHWMRDAIQGLFDNLDIGTQVFNRHISTNTHEGRTPIGEVVGKTLQHIGDKVHAIAAIYIYPNFRSMPLDVASIEAEMGFDSSDTGLIPSLIQSITGIALGNSSVDSPGFPGATLLGAVQAFAKQGDTGMATKAEVLQAIQELKLGPSDLFDVEVVLEDKRIAAKVKADSKDVYEHNKRVEKERDDLRTEIAQVKNTAAADTQKLTGELSKFKAKDRFGVLVKERKLTDQQGAYIQRNFDRFATEGKTDKEVDVDINKFIDTQLVDLGDMLKTLGITVPTPGTPLPPGSPPPSFGTPSPPPGPGSTDYTNPAANDFIPKVATKT